MLKSVTIFDTVANNINITGGEMQGKVTVRHDMSPNHERQLAKVQTGERGRGRSKRKEQKRRKKSQSCSLLLSEGDVKKGELQASFLQVLSVNQAINVVTARHVQWVVAWEVR